METIKREPMMIVKTGMKGIGRSTYMENNYKDYCKVETNSKNRQDKSITERILEASKQTGKVLLKTYKPYLSNKYNIRKVMAANVPFVIVIDDIGAEKIFNKNRIKNNINRFDLKNTEVYRLIKK